MSREIDYSNFDPIFKIVKTRTDLWKYAHKKNVRLYLVDAMPFDQWVSDGYPVAATNSKVLHSVPPDVLFQLPDSFYGIYYHPYALDDSGPTTKQFNCFMNRMDPFRQSWLYQFIRHDIFEHGYVSFNVDTSRVPWYKEYTAQAAFQDQFEKHLTIFQKEHDMIKNHVPYCNFDDTGDVTPICYDSKISLVLETYFHDNNVITYSEKIFRALQIPRPWLLFSHKHAVKNLRDMGFDVLDDTIDHSAYDDLDSSTERQTQILVMLKELVNRDIDHCRLQHAAKHNQNLLEKFSMTWHQDCKDGIDLAASYV